MCFWQNPLKFVWLPLLVYLDLHLSTSMRRSKKTYLSYHFSSCFNTIRIGHGLNIVCIYLCQVKYILMSPSSLWKEFRKDSIISPNCNVSFTCKIERHKSKATDGGMHLYVNAFCFQNCFVLIFYQKAPVNAWYFVNNTLEKDKQYLAETNELTFENQFYKQWNSRPFQTKTTCESRLNVWSDKKHVAEFHDVCSFSLPDWPVFQLRKLLLFWSQQRETKM